MFYVVDTSVILSDPHALERMSNLQLVLPMTVVQELEGNRTKPEVGYEARMALRYIEEYRVKGDLLNGVSTSDGGSIKIHMNDASDLLVLPEGYRTQQNDNMILATALRLNAPENEVHLMTNDLPLRLKAATVGLTASEYGVSLYGETFDSVQSINCQADEIDKLYAVGRLPSFGFEDYPINTMFILSDGGRSALTRKGDHETIELIEETACSGVKGRNARQRFALDLLSDPDVGIVSLGGQAGSGKTLMALAAGIQGISDRWCPWSKVVVFRPIEAVGDQELGFLPGTQAEKMEPWRAAVDDAMKAFMQPAEITRLGSSVEVLPLTHIRGRTFKDTFIIVDEAQNLDLTTLVTVLTRVGEGSKIALTHDVSQRDNHKVGKHDGVAKIINKLTGSPLFAHVTLNKTERSPIAALVAEHFDL